MPQQEIPLNLLDMNKKTSDHILLRWFRFNRLSGKMDYILIIISILAQMIILAILNYNLHTIESMIK